jgi:group I intron endonuclease
MAVIYAIECVWNQRVYVGCTGSTLNRRLNEHRSLLRKKKHTAVQMVSDCEKYGTDAFRMKVLEPLPSDATVEVKREAELRWMQHFADAGLLYNAQMISFGPGEGYKLRSHTPEANMKRRLAQLGKPKGHGAKISATKKALGQRPSREAYIKSREARRRNLGLEV